MSDMCQYPNCRCPFDMGPDNLCLIGKPNPGKGKKGGRCNITACQEPGAWYFNKSTRAYYCRDCAREINWPGGRADTLKLYGVPLLCELDEERAGHE